MTVALAAGVARELRDHAAACAPREACGLLLGRGRRVLRYHPAPAGGTLDGFSIAPDVFLTASRVAAAAALEVVGVFHSHPRGTARPSAQDEAIAALWGDLVWAIQGADGVLAAFQRSPGGRGLEPVPVVSSAAL